MLSRGPVMLTVDATSSDVTVPSHVRGPALALLVASNSILKKPLLDLEVDHLGIRCVMSFSGVNSRIDVPWSRVWRATSEARAVLWGERVPEGVTAGTPAERPSSTARSKLGHLTLVD